MNTKYLFLIISFCIFNFNCCSPELINLSDAKKQVIEYYESGKYEKDVDIVIKKAEKQFENITADKNSVVIFDVDETALSNYENDKMLDFSYSDESWNKWVKQHRAPAIKAVRAFYNFLLSKGFRVIFITGRSAYSYEDTKSNLLSAGYEKFDTLITRQSNEEELSALQYKTNKRIELVHKGYRIAGTVGDQWSDLEGEYRGIQIKLPNYEYTIE